MMIKNNLFLILFSTKENGKWDSWKKFASKNNYFFSTLKDPFERPIIRGLLQDKPVSIEAVYEGEQGKLEKEISLKIKSPIHNPKDAYFLVQDKKAHKSQSGIFRKSLHGICENSELEEKFFIKSNSERLPIQILKNKTLVNELISQNNFSIEILNYELILTSYALQEINKEFIELLKLFYSFLNTFEEISLEEVINRK